MERHRPGHSRNDHENHHALRRIYRPLRLALSRARTRRQRNDATIRCDRAEISKLKVLSCAKELLCRCEAVPQSKDPCTLFLINGPGEEFSERRPISASSCGG